MIYLLLSALTAYRALFTKGNLLQGQHVLIPGIGGGVATSATLMASAIGAIVSVTSRSDVKRQKSLQLPITQVFDSHSDWNEHLKAESVDIILDSIGPATFKKYFDVIKPNGKIVMFGASSGDEITIPARNIFFPQINILGTSMGSNEEFIAMLQIMEKYTLRPIVDTVYPLKEIAQAFQRMEQGEQFGNIAILIE